MMKTDSSHFSMPLERQAGHALSAWLRESTRGSCEPSGEQET